MNMDAVAVTAYKMNSNPAFHCLALAVMLALSVQAEDEIQGPTIKGVALEEEAVRLDVDFSNPFVWEEIQFKSIKTFPNMLPTLPWTSHSLSFGQFEPGMVDWFQYDFIMLGQYEVLDPHTIKATFLGGPEIIGKFDVEKGTLEFDGLEYRPIIKVPKFKVLASSNLNDWASVSPSGDTAREQIWSGATAVALPKSNTRTRFYRVELEE